MMTPAPRTNALDDVRGYARSARVTGHLANSTETMVKSAAAGADKETWCGGQRGRYCGCARGHEEPRNPARAGGR